METNRDTGMRVKNVQLNEEWEKFWVSFMIFHPSEDNYDELLFDCPKVGVHRMPMTPMPKEFNWMSSKYGRVMRPWQVSILFDNTQSEDGQFKSGADSNLHYSFIKRNRARGETISEREPKRWIDLQDPNAYRG